MEARLQPKDFAASRITIMEDDQNSLSSTADPFGLKRVTRRGADRNNAVAQPTVQVSRNQRPSLLSSYTSSIKRPLVIKPPRQTDETLPSVLLAKENQRPVIHNVHDKLTTTLVSPIRTKAPAKEINAAVALERSHDVQEVSSPAAATVAAEPAGLYVPPDSGPPPTVVRRPPANSAQYANPSRMPDYIDRGVQALAQEYSSPLKNRATEPAGFVTRLEAGDHIHAPHTVERRPQISRPSVSATLSTLQQQLPPTHIAPTPEPLPSPLSHSDVYDDYDDDRHASIAPSYNNRRTRLRSTISSSQPAPSQQALLAPALLTQQYMQQKIQELTAEISTLRQENSRLETQLTLQEKEMQQQSKVSEKDESLTAKEIRLQEYQLQLQQQAEKLRQESAQQEEWFHQSLEQTDTWTLQNQAELQEWQEQLEILQHELETARHDQENELHQRKAEIVTRQSELDEREREIDQRETELKERESQLTELELKSQDNERKRQEQEHLFSKRLSKVEEREQVLQSKQQTILNDRRRLAGWEQRLEASVRLIEAEQGKLNKRQTELNEVEQRLQEEKQDLLTAWEDVEAQESSLQAKKEQLEKSCLELTNQRKEEEDRLEKAANELDSVVKQVEELMEERDKLKFDLDKDKQQAEDELSKLDSKIADKQKEFDDVKARIRRFSSELQRRQQEASEEAKDANSELDAILQQIEVARREKETVERSILALKKSEQELREKHESWQQKHKELVVQEEVEIRRMHDDADRALKEKWEKAGEKISIFSKSWTQKLESRKFELDTRLQRLESLESSIKAASTKVDHDSKAIQAREAELEKLHLDLNERLDRLNSAEHNASRTRQNLAKEINRLEALLEAERKEFDASLRRKDERLDAMTNEYRKFRSEFNARLSSQTDALESELDAVREKLHNLQHDHESLTAAKETIEKELRDKAQSLSQANTDIASLRNEKQEISLELSRVRLQLQKLQSRDETLQKEVLEENERERTQLQAAIEEYNECLTKLKQQEQTLLRGASILERREKELDKREAELLRQRQKDLMEWIASRPPREESEAVSAAFAKWARVALFDNEQQKANEMIQELEDQLRHADVEKQHIESARLELVERHRVLAADKRKLEHQVQQFKRGEQKMRHEIEKLTFEKQQAMQASIDIGTTSGLELQRKVSEFNKNDEEWKRQFELANERIRRMAKSLQKKEMELNQKEQRLEVEVDKYNSMKTKVHAMAAQLSESAQDLSMDKLSTPSRRRTEEIDSIGEEEVESFDLWQPQMDHSTPWPESS